MKTRALIIIVIMIICDYSCQDKKEGEYSKNNETYKVEKNDIENADIIPENSGKERFIFEGKWCPWPSDRDKGYQYSLEIIKLNENEYRIIFDNKNAPVWFKKIDERGNFDDKRESIIFHIEIPYVNSDGFHNVECSIEKTGNIEQICLVGYSNSPEAHPEIWFVRCSE